MNEILEYKRKQIQHISDSFEKGELHKYFKREGTPGNYKYYYTEKEYKEAKGKKIEKKEKSKKFTFKTEKPTGRWRSFELDTHSIKLKGGVIGTIDDKEDHKIRLMVIKEDINEDSNPNVKWKWIMLKKESKTLQEAKDFLNRNIKVIMDKYELHSD